MSSESSEEEIERERTLEREWCERIVKNIIDLIILKLLEERPRWGYEMNADIKDRFEIYLSAGTLYPLLHTLEDKDFIVGVLDEKRRGRRIYKITAKGQEFLTTGEKILDFVVNNLRAPARGKPN